MGRTRHRWPCRRSDDGHLCRKEVHTLGRQWPCLWQPCTAIRKCGRCICCTCMGDGNHCSHYQDNGSSMARWHKGHSKGGRGWSGPCTARRKGICNWIGHKYYLSFLLHFFHARSLYSCKNVLDSPMKAFCCQNRCRTALVKQCVHNY